MPDEHRFRIESAHSFSDGARPHEFGLAPERDLLPPALIDKVDSRISSHPNQRHPLKVSPVLSRRFRPCHRELSRHILRRQLAAASPHAAPFQQIARQKLYVGFDLCGIHILQLRLSHSDGNHPQSNTENRLHLESPFPIDIAKIPMVS